MAPCPFHRPAGRGGEQVEKGTSVRGFGDTGHRRRVTRATVTEASPSLRPVELTRDSPSRNVFTRPTAPDAMRTAATRRRRQRERRRQFGESPRTQWFQITLRGFAVDDLAGLRWQSCFRQGSATDSNLPVRRQMRVRLVVCLFFENSTVCHVCDVACFLLFVLPVGWSVWAGWWVFLSGSL